MKKIFSLDEIKTIKPDFKIWDLVFLYWDLASGKTTLTKHFLNNILQVKEEITSPTYTYYNKYNWALDWKKIDIYHFDLYRLSNYDEFFAIAGEDILDNNDWIIFIEWPWLIEKYYKANKKIYLKKVGSKREIEIL